MRELVVLFFFTAGLLGTEVRAQGNWRVDSLLSRWPVRAHASNEVFERSAGIALLPSTIEITRSLSAQFPGIPVFADTTVIRSVQQYAGLQREQLQVLFGMAHHYLPVYEQALRKAGLPTALAYLPLALSASDPLCGSGQGEAGVWMLDMPHALRAGLKVTSTVDERHDVAKSTRAAVAILQAHLAQYRTQDEAILAMACGPANVARARAHAGGRGDLRALYPHVDPEHRDVIPLWMAFLYLSQQEKDLGLAPHEIQITLPVDTLVAERSWTFKALEERLALPNGQLRWLNPTLCAELVPKGARWVAPKGIAARLDSLALHESELLPGNKAPLTVRHTVRRGESLGVIARRYGIPVNDLKEQNRLKSDRINIGQVLEIRTEEVAVPEPERPDQTTEATEWYTIRSGDSLYMIAKRYPGITAERIMEFNAIGASIRPGQRIKIPNTP